MESPWRLRWRSWRKADILSLFETSIRPALQRDYQLLETWRKAYSKGSLELPHGYTGPSVDTVVAVDGQGQLMASLTGTLVLSLDPLIRNPLTPGPESLVALHALTRHLECNALSAGCRESFIAVPADEEKYMRIVERCGFVETAQSCKIYRRIL